MKSKNTVPELIVQNILSDLGLSFESHTQINGCTPDIILKKEKLAIFVHGCFWHQHGCPSVRQLKRNQFDIEMHKSTAKKRDVSNLELVRSAGYKPLVLWECELQQKQEVIKRIKRRVSLSTLLVS